MPRSETQEEEWSELSVWCVFRAGSQICNKLFTTLTLENARSPRIGFYQGKVPDGPFPSFSHRVMEPSSQADEWEGDVQGGHSSTLLVAGGNHAVHCMKRHAYELYVLWAATAIRGNETLCVAFISLEHWWNISFYCLRKGIQSKRRMEKCKAGQLKD